jgi:hypothetical protein
MRLAAAAVLLAGCVDSRSTVHGAYVYRYPDGNTFPRSLVNEQFQAYVLQGGGFVPYPREPVAGHADGTFEIPDVPDGPFLLRRTVGSLYGVFLPEQEHTFVETWDVLGGPYAASVATPTPVELDATGLAAWQPDDVLFVDCFGNASENVGPELSPPLGAGATAIHASFDWAAGYSWGAGGAPFLMDPAAGDELVISRSTAHTEGDLHTWTMTQVLAAPAPAQVEGEVSRVSGAFVDVPQAAQLAATIPGDALAATLGDGIAPEDMGVIVIAGPASGTGELLGPELVRMSTTAATAPLAASVAYGDPLPQWQPRATGWYTARRTVHMKSGTIEVPYTAFTESRPLAGATFQLAALAPVANVTVQGAPPTGDAVAVPPNTAVTLDFTAPPEGVKGRVIVWRIDRAAEAAYVVFDHAPVALPPDIFQDGGRYTFQIDVFSDEPDGVQRTASTYTDAVVLVAQ